MDLNQKLKILSSAAKYDSSCASSGTKRPKTNSLGNTNSTGICHSWSADGRCISLLKILYTNICIYDCAYCINRSSNDVKRASFKPEEICELTSQFYRRNYIEGLFLSSAVIKSPDYTMELLYTTLQLLRTKYKFNGYIHIKAMPGADERLIRKAGFYADRLSANIELPSSKSLNLLAPGKNKTSIFKTMFNIKNNIIEYRSVNKKSKYYNSYSPAGQSTQLIVGASHENDKKILTLSEALYNKFTLKRVYYSAYIPVIKNDNRLPVSPPQIGRENRLYQADWLLRFYGFKAAEILTDKNPNFDPDLDPKSFWALCNMHLFPIEINKADFEMLIRVPGIGLKSAQRIVALRRVSKISLHDIKKTGIILKRARYFITCKGQSFEKYDYSPDILKNFLLTKNRLPILTKKIRLKNEKNQGQLLLFEKEIVPSYEAVQSAISGEL